ncbi:MAG: hypothetical protein P4L92_19635 [Rudaea sp.]|nr:hypothetical protein [Rudaea sp.]
MQRGALLVLVALAGCMAGVKDQDNSVIRTRAVERWDLLIAHQAEKAYDYLSPGYRETKPREAYAKEMNGRGIRWSKVRFGSQECDAEVCKVHLSVDYSVDLGGLAGKVASSGLVVETWIKTKGQWYFLPDQLQPKLGKES